MVNKDLQVQARRSYASEKGQYYIFDILGLAVYDLEGRLLGKLTDVLSTGSNDVYVVTLMPAMKLLLAAIPDVITLY